MAGKDAAIKSISIPDKSRYNFRAMSCSKTDKMSQKMIKKITVALLCLLFSSVNITFSATAATQNNIDHIIAHTSENVNAGVLVENVNGGQVLYTLNANRSFVPASTTKLFTAYAALKTLGANFMFDTSITINKAQLNQGTLRGNVYVDFSGDPTLSAAQINELVNSLANSGVQHIDGYVVIINNDFDNASYGPGWMWDDLNLCYDEPITGIAVDHNCFSINVLPGPQVGDSTEVKLYKNDVPIKVFNHVYTAAADANCQINITSDSNNDYTLTGCVEKGNPDNAIRSQFFRN